MNAKNVKEAAKLLEQRGELTRIRSLLRTKPDGQLGLYAKLDDDGVMHASTEVSNETGIILMDRVVDLVDGRLAILGVEEDHSHSRS